MRASRAGQRTLDGQPALMAAASRHARASSSSRQCGLHRCHRCCRLPRTWGAVHGKGLHRALHRQLPGVQVLGHADRVRLRAALPRRRRHRKAGKAVGVDGGRQGLEPGGGDACVSGLQGEQVQCASKRQAAGGSAEQRQAAAAASGPRSARRDLATQMLLPVRHQLIQACCWLRHDRRRRVHSRSPHRRRC